MASSEPATAAHRTDETDLCPHCSKPLTAHRNHDCWPRCGKPNPDDPAELCSLPERHAELLNCPMCAYDVKPAPTTTAARRSWWRRLRDRVEAWLDEHLIEMDDRRE